MIKRVLRTLGTLVLSAVLMLTFAGSAGLTYAWFSGERGPSTTAIAAPAPKPKVDQPKVTAPVQNASVGVSVQSVTSPVSRGQNANLMVRTNPQAVCSIVLDYGTQKSTDSGLVDKKADEYGLVSWTWTVERAAPFGNWPLTITCKTAEKSGVVTSSVTVKQGE